MVTKPEYLDDDDEPIRDEPIRDGEGVRVPLTIMDSAGHRPGFVELTDELRERRAATRDEYVAGLRDAWRLPAQRGDLPAVGKSDSGGSTMSDADDDPMQRRTAARDAYVRNLAAAWKVRPLDQAPDDDANPVSRHTGSNAASAVQRELETWQGRGGDLSDLARAVEAHRRAVHAEFSQRLSNAWRLSHY